MWYNFLFLLGDHDDPKMTLSLPETIFLEEPANGRCTVSNIGTQDYQIDVKLFGSRKYCDIHKDIGKQLNFTVTCRSGSASSIRVCCIVHSHNKDILPVDKRVQGNETIAITYVSI